jgi:hypothetical protein
MKIRGRRTNPTRPRTRTHSTKPQTKTFPGSLPAPPLAWVHAFAKQGAAWSALPQRARTPPTRAACPCGCCGESQPARPGIRQPPSTRASLQQTSASATTPSRAMTLPPLSRNEQPHWTSPNLPPWQPWRRVPDLAPCTATPPRGGTHPEGMNNTGPLPTLSLALCRRETVVGSIERFPRLTDLLQLQECLDLL